MKFEKNPQGRKQKITTLNLENYQLEMMKRKNLNISQLVRYLLEQYLASEYPDEYLRLKKDFQDERE